jgi:hypothetical protein
MIGKLYRMSKKNCNPFGLQLTIMKSIFYGNVMVRVG